MSALEWKQNKFILGEAPPGAVLHFDAGEEMRTEVSAKFTRERLEADYEAAGFRLAHWWTDAAGDYALTLAAPQ